MSREGHDWTLGGAAVTIIAALERTRWGLTPWRRAFATRVGTPPSISASTLTCSIRFAPGTGTPEIGGLATCSAGILRRLRSSLIGMDVVEVAPAYDVARSRARGATVGGISVPVSSET